MSSDSSEKPQQEEQQSQQPAQQASSRPHVCPIPGCNQAYARIEHCERHVRTHDPNAAYACSDCGKSFARSDVLRRHSKIHSRERIQANEGAPRSSGKRCARACQTCAAAKVRCSGETPTCQRCRELSKTCEYELNSSSESTRPAKRVRIEGDPDDTFEDLRVSPAVSDGQASSSAATFDLSTASLDVHSHIPSAPFQSFQPHSQPPSSALLSSSLPTDWLAPQHNSTFDAAAFSAPSASCHAPTQPSLPSTSSSMLDSVLSLALQQQQDTDTMGTTIQDDLAAAFFLPSDEGFFWHQFVSSPEVAVGVAALQQSQPPANPAEEAPPSPETTATPSTPGHRSRILITAGGLPSRHGSPRPEREHESRTTSRWPTWNPTGEEGSVRLDGDASRSLADLALFGGAGFPAVVPRFDEQVRMSLLETLRFASMGDDEYHALYQKLANLPLHIFDLLLNLYFHHFHRTLPILHLPTFNPKKTLGQLLLVVLGVGAVFAPVSAARQFGRVLIEVARRGLEHLINRDNRLARSLPVAQAQMLWATLRWSGDARTTELANVFRSIHTTMLRHQGVFDETSPRQPADSSPPAQWSAFIANEERRRTAMACFLLEGEVAALLHLPPAVAANDLKTLLPCSDELWNAPTAEAWLHLQATASRPMAIPAVVRLLSSDSLLPLPASVVLSPLGAHVLVQILDQNAHHVRQLRNSGMASHADLIMTQIRRSLARLARGKDEFSPRFNGGVAGEEDESARYAAPHVWYHLAQISTHVMLDELDVVASKASEEEAVQATAKWTGWMASNPEQARTVALHAGQIFRIVRDHPTQGTHESSTLFYASLILYLYTRSIPAPSASTDPFSWSASTSPESSVAGLPQRLDVDFHSSATADSSSFLALGGPAALDALPGTPLAGSKAAAEVLRSSAALLAAQSAWGNGRVCANVLQGMAQKEDEATGGFGA
ncbi:hypothetical protein JCM8097_009522 [Rhodosporidiobolus ruineniae]